jgi:serine protease inhibitor
VFGDIRADDEGTETAAVTGAGANGSAAPLTFLVDRPFAFTFSDRQTGTIHFLGTIHDPGVTAAAPKRTGVSARLSS